MMSSCQLVSETVVALTVVEWPYTHIKSSPKQQQHTTYNPQPHNTTQHHNNHNTAVSSQVLLSCSLQGDSRGHHGMPWRLRKARCRECRASQGATAPLVAATRADDRRSCSGGNSPPLCAEGGSCTEQRSTEPEDR